MPTLNTPIRLILRDAESGNYTDFEGKPVKGNPIFDGQIWAHEQRGTESTDIPGVANSRHSTAARRFTVRYIPELEDPGLNLPSCEVVDENGTKWSLMEVLLSDGRRERYERKRFMILECERYG